jgi:FkbM family methyltransferase
MTAGETLDALWRRVQLRRWRRRARIAVRCGGRTATLQARPGTTDAEVVWQCFGEHQYEIPGVKGQAPLHRRATEAVYESALRAGRTPLIIDCGANIGASAVWFDLRFPRSSIVAVEPAAANQEMLKLNCADRANIRVVEAGIGPDDGEAFLQDGGGGHWGYQTGQARTGSQVRILSLAKLIEASTEGGTTPFILKIDVEGAEKLLFDHSLDVIARFPVIILEPHDFCMPGAGTASPFFAFHASRGRDFLFGFENVFSFDVGLMREGGARI